MHFKKSINKQSNQSTLLMTNEIRNPRQTNIITNEEMDDQSAKIHQCLICVCEHSHHHQMHFQTFLY